MTLPDGSEGPQNTGYLIDGVLFHPGDGLSPEGVTSEIVAVPIAGPNASPRGALAFIEATGAQKVIPIHYDNTTLFPGHPTAFESILNIVHPTVTCIILQNGASVEL